MQTNEDVTYLEWVNLPWNTYFRERIWRTYELLARKKYQEENKEWIDLGGES